MCGCGLIECPARVVEEREIKNGRITVNLVLNIFYIFSKTMCVKCQQMQFLLSVMHWTDKRVRGKEGGV